MGRIRVVLWSRQVPKFALQRLRPEPHGGIDIFRLAYRPLQIGEFLCGYTVRLRGTEDGHGDALTSSTT
jgi:hypothetical protein